MRVVSLVALLSLTACAVPTPTPARSLAAPTTPLVLPTTAPTTPVLRPTTVPASIVTLAPSTAIPTRADAAGGIVFGKPVALTTGTTRAVAVLATNTTDRVATFTVTATYSEAGRIVATAAGTVNDLAPQQTRAALLGGTEQIPASAQAVRVDVGTMILEAPTTPGSAVAGRIRFGATRVRPNATLPTVEVEVTNDDTAAHTLTLQAALLRGAELVGVATGAVNDLAPGQTRTATLLVQGGTDGHDRIVPAVQTVVQ